MKNHPTVSIELADPEPFAEQPLVTANELLDLLWSSSARPSRAWLRNMTKRGVIPVVNAGRRVFYDVPSVRRALLHQAELDRLARAASNGNYVRYRHAPRKRPTKSRKPGAGFVA